jgi:hypothetical protein
MVINQLAYAWPKGTTVYYSIDPNLDATQKSQYAAAFAAWTTANQSNGSGVSFQPGTPSNPATYIVSATPITVPNSNPPQTCTPPANSGAYTCPQVTGGTTITNVVTVLNPTGTFAGTGIPGVPFWSTDLNNQWYVYYSSAA